MTNLSSEATDEVSPEDLDSESQKRSRANLAKAPENWLENSIAKLRVIAVKLSAATDADDVIRRAVTEGRETLGFERLSVWLFEEGDHSLTGTFGVNQAGEIVDERHCRVFDHGSIKPQRAAWNKAPYYFLETEDPLRDSEGSIIAHGVHITAPILQGGLIRGFLSVDDLLKSPAINNKCGSLLSIYADTIAGFYFTKQAEADTSSAIAASERADAIKSEFLGMLSHEVRTPLNAILGFAQLLCLKDSSPEQLNLAKTIEQSGDHLLNLLSSMMDYANLANRDLRKRYAACDPIQIASETVDSFTQIARQKNLEISFKHSGDFEGALLADATGLRQIITNLIQNAIKFTDSGSIKVRAQSQPKPKDSIAIQFSVEDTGCGIDPQHQEQIFKPFKQIDSSLTRNHGGIGMGLAIVERLVVAMGGQISLQSEPDKGSRFTADFVFKYATKAPVISKSHNGTRVPSSKDKDKIRILIAEDNENNRTLLLHILETFGYRAPDIATNGAKARTLINSLPYDLLILDLQIPKLDGLALTRLIRKGLCGPINQDVPIIGLTAHDIQFNQDRSIAAGMNEYLTKPFKVDHLQSVIQNLIRS